MMKAPMESRVGPYPAPVASTTHGAARADVQGLRALAVVLVVLYHAGVPGLRGGFIGVDVFFVISGFLITGLLAREAASTGHVAFARFFARRARRLLPAALFVTAVVVLAALWIYPPMEQREIVSGARAASLYVSNLWLAGRSVDYLGGGAESNPLLHMWSLAVEEQFYIVWPFVVAFAMRLAGGRRCSLVIGIISAISLLACVAMTWRSQPWAFFLMPFRAWEFGAGALVQVALLRGLRFDHDAWPRLIGWIGLLLVVASAVLLDTSRLFPGLWALAPTLGTAGVLLGMHASRRGVGALLGTAPLPLVGDLSYSWYLWHWPFLVASHVLMPHGTALTTAAAVLLSIGAAAASYRWVEGPIRFSPPSWLRPDRPTLVSALAASALLAIACTGTASWIGMRGMDPQQRAFANGVDDTASLHRNGCFAGFSDTDLPAACAFGPAGANINVVLFGDSHAAQWFPALQQLAVEKGWRLIALTKSSCPAVAMSVYSDVLRRTYLECDQWRERMFKRIEAEHPALVVVSSAWQNVDPAQWRSAAARTSQRLAAMGTRQLWIRDTPSPGFNGPLCLARARWQGHADFVDICSFDRDEVMAHTAALHEAERGAVAATHDARWLDLTSEICPVQRCTELRDGRPLYSDGNHIAASWAARESPRFELALQGWALESPSAAQPVR